jgi:hypothetical protein
MRCVLAAAGMVLLVACGGRDPVDDKAKNTDGLPAINEPAPDATGKPPTTAVRASTVPAPSVAAPAGAASESAAAIPAALQGRWALAPNDCTSTRGDAKGLLVITATELRFYESRAIPGPNAGAATDSISGQFAFTGEGQQWTKFEALQLKGEELVRTESNPTASFTYAKCK